MSVCFFHIYIVGFNNIGGLRTTLIRFMFSDYESFQRINILSGIWSPILQAPCQIHYNCRENWWRALEDVINLRSHKSKTF